MGTRKAEVGWIEEPVCACRGVGCPVGLRVGVEGRTGVTAGDLMSHFQKRPQPLSPAGPWSCKPGPWAGLYSEVSCLLRPHPGPPAKQLVLTSWRRLLIPGPGVMGTPKTCEGWRASLDTWVLRGVRTGGGCGLGAFWELCFWKGGVPEGNSWGAGR